MVRLLIASLIFLSVSAKAEDAAAPSVSLGDQAVAEAQALTAQAGTTTEVTDTKSVAATKDLKETEIPVNLTPTKKAAGDSGGIFKIILTLAILGTLSCAGYFLFRRYAKNQPKNQATQIKVLTQHYLGPKKSLAIVRVAGESILIGVTDQNISMIKSLSLLDEDIPEETPKSFNSVFAKTDFAETRKNEAAHTADESQDDFSISGIKDFVSSRLKNMRTLE